MEPKMNYESTSMNPMWQCPTCKRWIMMDLPVYNGMYCSVDCANGNSLPKIEQVD